MGNYSLAFYLIATDFDVSIQSQLSPFTKHFDPGNPESRLPSLRRDTYNFGIEQFLHKLCETLNFLRKNFLSCSGSITCMEVVRNCQGPRSFLTSPSN